MYHYIDRYTMIQAGLCLITDGLYFTGFPFSSLLGAKGTRDRSAAK